MEKYKAKLQAYAWTVVACLSICLSASWWLELQDTQADLEAIVIEFAKSIDENADVLSAVKHELVKVQCEKSYLVGCLSGNMSNISLESLAEDLADARDFTVGLIHSTQEAHRRRQ